MTISDKCEWGSEGGGIPNIEWFHDLMPPASVATFISSTQQLPWIEVVEELSGNQPLQLASAVEGEYGAEGEHASRRADASGAGFRTEANAADRAQALRKNLLTLKSLRDSGLLDDGEYRQRRSDLLDSFMEATE